MRFCGQSRFLLWARTWRQGCSIDLHNKTNR